MTVTLANRVGAASSVRDPRRTMILAPLGTALIYPNEDEVINQLAEILNLSSDVLYFYAKRVPPDVRRNATDDQVEAGYRAFVRCSPMRRIDGQLDDSNFSFGGCARSDR
jgi:hypothetical protein